MDITEFGQVIGHKSRVAMLHALMGGKALPASELAWHAGVTNQTATSHLNKLVQAGVLYRRKCGRFQYYEINGESVASIIEQIATAVPESDDYGYQQSVKPELKKARFCYNHLAGELGVEISRILVQIEALTISQDSFHLPTNDHPIYRTLGIDLDKIRNVRHRVCPRCIDWTERLPHVAGALGAAIASKLVESDIIIRSGNDRSVAVTRSGRRFLIEKLGFSQSFFANEPRPDFPE